LNSRARHVTNVSTRDKYLGCLDGPATGSKYEKNPTSKFKIYIYIYKSIINQL
jgi:hypothetical protein